jgi:hypothetical protein
MENERFRFTIGYSFFGKVYILAIENIGKVYIL